MENQKRKRDGRILVNETTGEVLLELEDGDRIVRRRSIEAFRENDGFNARDEPGIKISEDFVKGNVRELRCLLPKLTQGERAMLMSLMPYCRWRTCCVEHDNGTDINLDSIIHISGQSRMTVTKSLNGLIDKDVLYKGKNSAGNQYFINPWIMHKGNTVNDVLRRMFRNYRVLSKGGIRWKDLPSAEWVPSKGG